jgi:hypothetical protein
MLCCERGLVILIAPAIHRGVLRVGIGRHQSPTRSELLLPRQLPNRR